MEYEIIKIVGIAIIAVMSLGVLRNIKPEYAIYLVLASCLVIFVMLLGKLLVVFDYLKSIYEGLTYGQTFFPVLIKVIAVAYITDFTSQICRDAGEGAIATKTELAGKVIIFCLSMPILVTIIETLNSIL